MKKKCSKCRKIKDASKFNKDRNRKCGITSQCKQCIKENRKSSNKCRDDNLLNLSSKMWKIIYYIGDVIYDEQICRCDKKPTRIAELWQGLATHFNIEKL